jgi:hypothetical protein
MLRIKNVAERNKENSCVCGSSNVFRRSVSPNTCMDQSNLFSFSDIDKLILKYVWKCKGPPEQPRCCWKRRTKLEDPYFQISKLIEKQ